jgi:alkyldihydroxyacetonephosphate synthase
MTAADIPPGPGAPTAPIALDAAAATARIPATRVEVSEKLVARLAGACAEVTTDAVTVAEASRDWWPLAMTWALDAQVAGLASVVARPRSTGEVAAVLAICDEARVPVTTAAGRSGVCGSSVPLHGGVVLDVTNMVGITDVDDTSLVVEALPGTFGDLFELELRAQHGLTCGHWPQSMALSTVGGWVACRGAGQYSTRYGKIEDIVEGLEVVLADGTVVRTGGFPRAAVGPDLTQIFVGSEGTLGVFTSVRLRAHPAPDHEERAAYSFDTFADAADACRRVLRRGGTPAALRVYDAVEADRNYHTGDRHLLLVLDEGDPVVVGAAMRVVAEECEAMGAQTEDVAHVQHWVERRNDVAALEKLISGGLVVDTMEVTGRWADVPRIYDATIAALLGVEGTLAASAHLSHSYTDGACLYFTFAGKPEADAKDAYYTALWDAGQHAAMANGATLSHHHGVGISRARFVRTALGSGLDVLASLKTALDPHGILNPGKLGLPNAFGSVAWP